MIIGSRGSKRPPLLPRGVRIYAIGDVHGRADLLERLLSRVDADIVAHPVPRAIHVLVGDYIDRGPASREVVDLLIDAARTREMFMLRGNHDVFVKEFLLKSSVTSRMEPTRRLRNIDVLRVETAP